MDLQYLIDRLETMVTSAKKMPITNKLQMDEQELAVHGPALEVIAVGEHQLGVELQAALAKAPKHPDNVLLRKEREWAHHVSRP